MVAYRRFPRMDAKATTVRPAQRGELVQGVAEACNLPAGWVQTRSPDGAAAHHGLWLPRQFLVKVNRSYELAAHMARQSKLKDDTSRNKASEAAAGRARGLLVTGKLARESPRAPAPPRRGPEAQKTPLS